MGLFTNALVAIIVVVTLALFLVGFIWRLYHGGGYVPLRSDYDLDREPR